MSDSRVHSHEFTFRYVVVDWGQAYEQIWYKYCDCGMVLW